VFPVVTMFLGLYMPQLTQPLWCIIVMSAYIGFHAVIEIVLAVHMHADKCCRSTKRAYNTYRLYIYNATLHCSKKLASYSRSSADWLLWLDAVMNAVIIPTLQVSRRVVRSVHGQSFRMVR